MAFETMYTGSGSLSVSSSVNLNTTMPEATDGIYQIYLDLDATDALQYFRLVVYENCKSDSISARDIHDIMLTVADGYQTPPFVFMHSWEATLYLIDGSNAKNYSYRIVRIY